MQLPQLRHGRERHDIRDCVVAQIELFQLGQADQRIDRIDGAAAERQLRQVGKRPDLLQQALRHGAAREVELSKRRQLADQAQVKSGSRVMDGQRLEARKSRQVVQRGHLRRKLQLLDRPKLVGHQAVARGLAELLAHIALQCGVLQRDLLHNVSDRIPRVGSAADKAVVVHGDGDDRRFTALELNGAGVKIRFQ